MASNQPPSLPIIEGDLTVPYQVIGPVQARVTAKTAFSKHKTYDDVNPKLAAAAQQLGANAVINVHYDRGISATSWKALTAYGTAVIADFQGQPAASPPPPDEQIVAPPPASERIAPPASSLGPPPPSEQIVPPPSPGQQLDPPVSNPGPPSQPPPSLNQPSLADPAASVPPAPVFAPVSETPEDNPPIPTDEDFAGALTNLPSAQDGLAAQQPVMAQPPAQTYQSPALGAVGEDKATMALICGIGGLLCCGPLAIVAFVISSNARQEAAETGRPLDSTMNAARILGIAGMVVFATGIIISIILRLTGG